jgi:hypothetical protein
MEKHMSREADFKVAELREFAGFKPREQRYIKRSLDVALGTTNPVREWARDRDEEYSIRVQVELYSDLSNIRELLQRPYNINQIPETLPPLTTISVFDLNQYGLEGFSAYRFLYERLLGARVRPWLPAAFCGAAALPHLKPERRRSLLQSISEAAATASGWSEREPFFFPKWVDKPT